MKTRILRVYENWVVRFPFAVTVYCGCFSEAAHIAVHEFDAYLLATEKVEVA
jgi:hypothetical protein